ncbi:MAG: hypothetical protein IJP91_09160 [Synergistaceae bacterium]|nr:hypothetical protein [Synergistaceae bacterium]
MRKNNNNSEKLRFTLKIVAALSLVVVLTMGLGFLRFHAARLAYYLDSVNKSIQKYADEEVVLRQELSGPLAPIRIYSYCKENLGMQKVLKAETLPMRVRGNSLTASKKNSTRESEGWRAGLAWLFGTSDNDR